MREKDCFSDVLLPNAHARLRCGPHPVAGPYTIGRVEFRQRLQYAVAAQLIRGVDVGHGQILAHLPRGRGRPGVRDGAEELVEVGVVELLRRRNDALRRTEVCHVLRDRQCAAARDAGISLLPVVPFGHSLTFLLEGGVVLRRPPVGGRAGPLWAHGSIGVAP